MDVIQGKIDVVIRLLEQLVENTNMEMEIVDEQGRVVSPREIRIDIPPAPAPPSLGEGDSREEIDLEAQDDRNTWGGAHYETLRIGERHRFIEQRDDRGTIHLHLQYWDDRRNSWESIHRF